MSYSVWIVWTKHGMARSQTIQMHRLIQKLSRTCRMAWLIWSKIDQCMRSTRRWQWKILTDSWRLISTRESRSSRTLSTIMPAFCAKNSKLRNSRRLKSRRESIKTLSWRRWVPSLQPWTAAIRQVPWTQSKSWWNSRLQSLIQMLARNTENQQFIVLINKPKIFDQELYFSV